MKKYELALVLSEKIEDSARDALLSKAKDYISRAGGNVTDVDAQGRKRLAYEIQGMTEAYYYYVAFESETDAPAKIEENVRIMDHVLRFLIVSVDPELEEKKKQIKKRPAPQREAEASYEADEAGEEGEEEPSDGEE